MKDGRIESKYAHIDGSWWNESNNESRKEFLKELLKILKNK